jgi:hypothetical protein
MTMHRLCLVALLATTACAHASLVRAFGGIPKEDLNALVGRSVGAVIAEWGAPDRYLTLADSTKVYSWDHDVGTSTRTRDGYDGSVRASSSQSRCTISIIASPKDTVVRWTSKGDCPIG